MGGMLAARTKKRCTPDRLSLPQWYMRQRWYDPTLQRFISRDPIGLAGGANLYQYGEANPVDNVDPWGTQPGSGVDPDPDSSAYPWPRPQLPPRPTPNSTPPPTIVIPSNLDYEERVVRHPSGLTIEENIQNRSTMKLDYIKVVTRVFLHKKNTKNKKKVWREIRLRRKTHCGAKPYPDAISYNEFEIDEGDLVGVDSIIVVTEIIIWGWSPAPDGDDALNIPSWGNKYNLGPKGGTTVLSPVQKNRYGP